MGRPVLRTTPLSCGPNQLGNRTPRALGELSALPDPHVSSLSRSSDRVIRLNEVRPWRNVPRASGFRCGRFNRRTAHKTNPELWSNSSIPTVRSHHSSACGFRVSYAAAVGVWGKSKEISRGEVIRLVISRSGGFVVLRWCSGETLASFAAEELRRCRASAVEAGLSVVRAIDHTVKGNKSTIQFIAQYRSICISRAEQC